MTSTDKGLYFFKVFDLSFFAPGLVIALTLTWVWEAPLVAIKAPINTAAGIIALIAAIGAIYVLGLSVFSIMWDIYRKKSRYLPPKDSNTKTESGNPSSESTKTNESQEWPPFPVLFKGPLRDELILYFWYLRATCLGLAFAFLVSFFLLLGFSVYDSNTGTSVQWLPVSLVMAMELIAAIFLVRRGLKFGRCVDKSLEHRAWDWYESGPRD